MGALSYLWLGSFLRLPAVSSLHSVGQSKSASDQKPIDKQLPSSPKKKSNLVFANE